LAFTDIADCDAWGNACMRLQANSMAKRTVIVDTSNEIGGDGDVPHPGIGDARRMQVGEGVLVL
jgi:stage III sporulation protein SpoIIIAA